jgi:hypothetical protein
MIQVSLQVYIFAKKKHKRVLLGDKKIERVASTSNDRILCHRIQETSRKVGQLYQNWGVMDYGKE